MTGASITSTMMDWNAIRYDPSSAQGHVESWFWKANSPDGSKALWVKATVFAPAQASKAVAEAWAIVFDRKRGNFAARVTVPLGQARFHRESFSVTIGDVLRMAAWNTSGSLHAPSARIGWELQAQGDDAPLVLLPYPWMYRAPFPKAKLVSPLPDARFDGVLRVDDRELRVDGWRGMQGHNWGRGHADSYAWCHVNQWDNDEEPLVFEGVSARVRVGPVLTPLTTLTAVRLRGHTHNLSGLASLLRNRGRVGMQSWQVRAKGDGIELDGEFIADRADMVGLRYPNPDNATTWCLNSKLASGRISIRQAGEPERTWLTQSAALEIGTRDPRHGIPVLA